MTTNTPLTPQEFMNRFELHVQSYGAEFFFAGARELLGDLRGWGLEINQGSIDYFLSECLKSTKKEPLNPPEIDFVRNRLRAILGLESDDL
jgi:hypothetical protein